MMTQVFTGPPTITTHPTSQLTNVSMSVTLDCEGTGRGSVTYQWESSNITEEQWINISTNKELVVMNLEQPKQYRCVVSNEAGTTKSNVATIMVLSKSFIKQYCCIFNVLINNRNLHSTSHYYHNYSIRRCYINLFSNY